MLISGVCPLKSVTASDVYHWADDDMEDCQPVKLGDVTTMALALVPL